MSFRYPGPIQRALVVVLAFFAQLPVSQGVLTFDMHAVLLNNQVLTAPNNSKNLFVSTGDVVQLTLFARVTGVSTDSSNDGFQDAFFSIVTSNGGSIRSNIFSAATLFSPYKSNGSKPGVPIDLDGDGDLDLGSVSNSSLTKGMPASVSPGTAYIRTLASVPNFDGVPIQNGQQYALGTIDLFISEALEGPPIAVNYYLPTFTFDINRVAARWVEDGVAIFSGGAGTGVRMRGSDVVIQTALPEPGTVVLLLAGLPALSRWRMKKKGTLRNLSKT